MAEHGIRVLTTDVGDRHVLAALRASGAVLGGEQSGHVISLDGHVTGDGLAAALLLCRALNGRSLAEAAGGDATACRRRSGTFRSPGRGCPPRSSTRWSGSTTSSPAGAGSSFAPPGTEPLVRVLVEAEDEQEAEELCGSIAHLVRQQLG